MSSKWALILGASSGFGAATSIELAKRGLRHLRRALRPALDAAERRARAGRGEGGGAGGGLLQHQRRGRRTSATAALDDDAREDRRRRVRATC